MNTAIQLPAKVEKISITPENKVFDLVYRREVKQEVENARYLLDQARKATNATERQKYIARSIECINKLV